MPSDDERLCQVTLKIKRAKEHVNDLEREIAAFLATKPYRVGTKHDPKTRKLVYYVSRCEPTPKMLSLIAGDAIQNLVCALDHMAFQLVCRDTGDHPPNLRKIYFPISDSASEYERRKGKKIEGARQLTFDAIDAIKPYKGGNDLLWQLGALNNIEKHRSLLAVGSCAAGVDILKDLAHHMRQTPLPGFSPEAVSVLERMSLFIRPADSGFPLREGFELFVGGVDEEPNPKMEFRFDVALSEPGIVESQSLLATIRQMTTAVEETFNALAPLLEPNP